MTTAAVAVGGTAGAASARLRLTRLAAWHPEWWLLVAVAPAWGAVVAHAIHDGASAISGHAYPAGGAGRLVAEAGAWLVMVMAMMVPVVVPRVRQTAWSCIGRVRNAAMVQTVAGVVLAWAVFGFAVVPIVIALPVFTPVAAVAAWMLAAAWQLTPVKRLALRRGHALPIPRGVDDGWQRFRVGIAHGSWCVVSCGPLMVVMAWASHPVTFAAALTAGLVAERVAYRPERARRRLAVGIVALSLVSVLVAGGV